MHELAGPQAGRLRDHHRQQRIRSDIERHAEKNVRAALVKLTGEFAVRHVELEQRMARRQRHPIDLGHVPRADDQPARVRIAADLVDHLRDLVDMAAVRRGPTAPLVSVNRSEVAVGIGPFVPNRHVVVVQIADVGIAAQEPQQLMNNRTQVQLFGRQRRKPRSEVETHLIAERTDRTGTRAVAFHGAAGLDMAEQVEILLHVVMMLSDSCSA